MKYNNICYAPVTDCGGYGGNWYWNSIGKSQINGGIGIGLFYILPNNYHASTSVIYVFTNGINITGSNLLQGTWGGGKASGNSSISIISCPNSQSVLISTNIYNYTNNTVNLGSNFTNAVWYGSASGNENLGIFIGFIGDASTTYFSSSYQKYVYSSNTTNVTNNSVNSYFRGSSSAGTNMFGIFNMGSQWQADSTYASTDKYVYASDVISNGSNLFNGLNRQDFGSATSNATYGVFYYGESYINNSWNTLPLNTNNYYFSNDTVVSGALLTAPSVNSGATGNDTIGVFAIGNEYTILTNLYVYSNNTIFAGSALMLETITVDGHTYAASSSYNPGVNS